MKPIPFNSLAKLLELHHESQTLVKGVAIDSRKVLPGDLFFALPGNKVDGHAFIGEAVAKGAIGAIVNEAYTGNISQLPCLRVPDVLMSLQDLARKNLTRCKSKVIAITGSIGKTTTKEFARHLLHTRYKIFASPLSYNSQATLPLSILLADGDEDFLILEMGMTHAGNLKNLISIAPPAISLMTTLAVQHTVNFSDGLAGIGREKAVIFSDPKTELGILHHDMPFYHEICSTGSCCKKSFSLVCQEADYYLEFISKGVKIYAKGEPPCEMVMHLPIRGHYQNFLGAVALARNLEIPWHSIREAAPYLKLPSMRFEKTEIGGILFINDAYNANPDSMKAALESLPKPQPGGKTIAVLGEMDALGMYSDESHAMVADVALQHVDTLLCLGSRCAIMYQIWSSQKRQVELFYTRKELEDVLKRLAKQGDVVLLKGARAHALDQILNNFLS